MRYTFVDRDIAIQEEKRAIADSNNQMYYEMLASQDLHEQANPNSDIDIDGGQCVCGKYNCRESYVHWTSGF
jgi:hypothetical protein